MQVSGEGKESEQKDFDVMKSICESYYPGQVDFTRIGAPREAELPADKSDERYLQETGCITEPKVPKESQS